jgi:hypothetical protein
VPDGLTDHGLFEAGPQLSQLQTGRWRPPCPGIGNLGGLFIGDEEE